jgi:hypothetical protein
MESRRSPEEESEAEETHLGEDARSWMGSSVFSFL